MLDVDSYIHQVVEMLGVLAKVVHGNSRMRMQRRNVQQGYVRVHSWLSVDITTHAQVRAPEHVVVLAVLTFGPLVTGKGIDDVAVRQNIRLDFHDRIGFSRSKVCVDQPGVLFLAENNACCQRVCRVVHRHAGKVCQDLSCHKVCLTLFRVEQGLGRDHIVVAILGHLVPQALRHRLIPRKSQLLMMDAQFDFKLL